MTEIINRPWLNLLGGVTDSVVERAKIRPLRLLRCFQLQIAEKAGLLLENSRCLSSSQSRKRTISRFWDWCCDYQCHQRLKTFLSFLVTHCQDVMTCFLVAPRWYPQHHISFPQITASKARSYKPKTSTHGEEEVWGLMVFEPLVLVLLES